MKRLPLPPKRVLSPHLCGSFLFAVHTVCPMLCTKRRKKQAAIGKQRKRTWWSKTSTRFRQNGAGGSPEAKEKSRQSCQWGSVSGRSLLCLLCLLCCWSAAIATCIPAAARDSGRRALPTFDTLCWFHRQSTATAS